MGIDARRGGDMWTGLVLPIRAQHHSIFQDAGARGRPYGPTRARWWLGVR